MPHVFELAASGRARCRGCGQAIEDGRFEPGGFVHLACREAYFETGDILEQVLHFSPALSDAEREELRRALAA